MTTGKIAYEAYAGHTGWKSAVTGVPLPPYEKQAPLIAEAWKAAAAACGPQWKMCRDEVPEPSADARYLVTVAATIPDAEGRYSVTTAIGMYLPPWESDTEPEPGWVVLDENPVDEDSGAMSDWEDPALYNCIVFAWARFPGPFTGAPL